MADGYGLACISDFGAAKSLENAVKLASEPEWLECCRPMPIPSIPLKLATVDQAYLKDLRSQNRDDQEGTAAAYSDFVVARAAAVADNQCRLRGALWCWRRLRQEYNAAPDEALKQMGRRVRKFLADEWGVTNPPMTYGEAHAMAVEIVQGRAT